MSGWIAQTPAFVVALGLLVVPGLPVALSVRTRGIVRLGIAIAVSLGMVGAASLLAPTLGLRWSILPVAIVAVMAAAVALGLRLVARRSPGRAGEPRAVPRSAPWAWLGVAAAVLAWAVIVAFGIGDAQRPSQLYDALFHLNAVEFIIQTGDASPLHMTMTTPGAQIGFYPTLWHAVISLIVPAAGGVTAATNVFTVAAVALVWPVASAALTCVAFPARPTAAAWAAVASLAFSVFPLGFLNWGVLYPSLLGMLSLPLLISLVVSAASGSRSWSDRTLWVLIALAAAGATGLAHPSALLGGVALLVPYALVRVWSVCRRSTTGVRILLAGLVALGLALLVLVWIRTNVSTHTWLPKETMSQALGEVAFLSPVDRTAGLLLGPLAAFGVWRAARMRLWWVLASHGVSAAFFLAAAWLPVLPIRSFFVGVWYDDSTRVGALLAIWGLPLAGLGADWLIGALRARWAIRGRRRGALIVGALLVVAATSHLPMVAADLAFMRTTSFAFDADSQGLSTDEAKLFRETARSLGEGSRVIGDPLTGAGLLYAYTGHDVVFPHVTGRYGTDADFLAGHLAEGGPEVCAAVSRTGVTHALDFGHRKIFENDDRTFDGLHDLASSPVLTEVAREGDAALYEITGCG